jgi:hypothetical protein
MSHLPPFLTLSTVSAALLMKVSFSFSVEPEHRAELLKLGHFIPEVVLVEVEPAKIPEALRADVMSQLKFDEEGRLRQPRTTAQQVPVHAAHSLRTLFLALSREAHCLRRVKTRARVAVLVGDAAPAPRYGQAAERAHLSNAAHLIQVGTLAGRFSLAELCGLAEAHSRPFAPCVDVDKRHLLLLQVEVAAELAQENGYDQPELLDKVGALTMPEGDALYAALQRHHCNARGFATNTHNLKAFVEELGR